MDIVQVNINELKASDYNPRKITEKQKEDIKTSIERFGMVEPIVVNSASNRKNVIIGGHQRYYVCKELGWKEMPVVYINIPDIKKEQELNLRLNKNLGDWDYDLLANFDEDILNEVGFESEELDKIFDLDSKDIDEVPEPPEEPKSKLGDLYQLGEHRLLCGDATKKEDVERLMDGQKADMVFTDPPYNVDYGSVVGHPSYKRTQGRTRLSKERGREYSIKNDKQSPEEWIEFVKGYMMELFNSNNGAFYICMSNKEMYSNKNIFEELGGHWASFIIWNKSHFVMGMQDYQRKYEPILYGWKEGKKHYWCGDRNQSDVWDIDRPTKSVEHPTMKPIELCALAIQNSSKRQNIVLDTFGGSGSTLIAAEQLNRKCYMMEIDPKYVDVIISRWEKLTGNKAKKL